MLDGIDDGILDGIDEGMLDGIAEGIADGILEGIAEGIMEGIEEGLLEGIAEGMADGGDEGAAATKPAAAPTATRTDGLIMVCRLTSTTLTNTSKTLYWAAWHVYKSERVRHRSLLLLQLHSAPILRHGQLRCTFPWPERGWRTGVRRKMASCRTARTRLLLRWGWVPGALL